MIEQNKKAQQVDLAALAGLSNFPKEIEIVTLPSQGLLYPENHPLYGRESVELYHLSGKEENILSNKSFIKDGSALDRMLQSLLVDPTLRIEQFLACDKTALSIAARITGYGHEYDVSVKCPNCKNETVYSFDLNKVSYSHGFLECDANEFEQSDRCTYFLKLHEDITVELKLLTVKDETDIAKMVQSAKKNKLDEQSVTELLRCLIVSVNGVDRLDVIRYFLENAPAKFLQKIREAYNKLNPSVSLKQKYTCFNCEFEDELEPPYSISFLYPNT